MGIGAIYKELTFGGDQSGKYGLYISGAGAFNAPQRDVEMVTIPGRNGAFSLDHGRFENIEVTYPAGIFGTDDNDFAQKVSDIRAWLCSKKGYVRLTDEYNPNEYRMAVYKSGLEVSLAELKAGEFDLVFECMPQRFLTSGATAVTITNMTPVFNPTLFNSRPLFEVDGYGVITINGEDIEIMSESLGFVVISPHGTINKPKGTSATFTISPSLDVLNTGDTVEVRGGQLTLKTNTAVTTLSGFTQSGNIISSAGGINTNAIIFNFYQFTFQKGTAKTGSASVVADTFDGTQITASVSVSISSAGVITISVSTTSTVYAFSYHYGDIWGDSSKSALGNIFIDLDIGEAYKDVNGEIVSVNNAVYIPPELPELKPGGNFIRKDASITTLKLTPRWWTV